MVENLSLLNDNVERWHKVILFSISNYMFQAYQGCERQNQDSAPYQEDHLQNLIVCVAAVVDSAAAPDFADFSPNFKCV